MGRIGNVTQIAAAFHAGRCGLKGVRHCEGWMVGLRPRRHGSSDGYGSCGVWRFPEPQPEGGLGNPSEIEHHDALPEGRDPDADHAGGDEADRESVKITLDMTYLALGDSISIDDYTGVPGGGAASQLAKKLGADPFIDFTRDGQVSAGVLMELQAAAATGKVPQVDAVTLTIGGNDLLSGFYFREKGQRGAEKVAFETFASNLAEICSLLASLGCPVIMNTIYDPTDGDDSGAPELGLPAEARQGLITANGLIRSTAERHGFLLCDLEELFHGHGSWSEIPWLVLHIEPNLVGATHIALHWHRLLTRAHD